MPKIEDLNEVKAFIKKHFSHSDWAQKESYWFCFILCSKYKFLDIYYSMELDNFVLYIKNTMGYYFDCHGEIKQIDCNQVIPLYDLKETPEIFERLKHKFID